MTDAAKAPAQTDPADEAPKPKTGFDESLPYGTIHGGVTKAAFFQDGKYYDGNGKQVKV